MKNNKKRSCANSPRNIDNTNLKKMYGNTVAINRKSAMESALSTVCYINLIFYDLVIIKGVEELKIRYKAFIDLLHMMGFRLYDSNKPYVYVLIKDNLIEEYSISRIQKHFIDFIEKEHKPAEGVTILMILEKLYKSPSHYFSDARLSLLQPSSPIVLNKDTKDIIYLYFANGFAECTKKGVVFRGYSQLERPIWATQRNGKNYYDLGFWEKPLKNKEDYGFFYQFLKNIAGEKDNRLSSVMSIIGYLLHNYFDYELKAIILTDSKVTDIADGRSGKSLLCKAISNVRKLERLNGKDFNADNRHKYQTLNLDTQIVNIDDLKKSFDVETLYNDVTEGLSIERKGQQPKYLNAKIVLTTNKTLKLEGGSSIARFIEFELTDYYNQKYSPRDEFSHEFFTDWNNSEWNRFYNLMALCAVTYLRYGIIKPQPINLEKRKLIDQTSIDFVEFMEDSFSSNRFRFNERYYLTDIYREFINSYPEYGSNNEFSKTRNRNKFIKMYCEANGIEYKADRSNSKHYFEFFGKNQPFEKS